MKIPEIFRKHSSIGSLAGTLSSTAALFLMFRLAYKHLGPSVVGIWALIQGIMLISRLPDMGSAGNITRLVAVEVAKFGTLRLRNFLVAGIVVNTIPIVAVGLLIYLPAFYYLRPSAIAAGMPISVLIVLVGQSAIFGVLNSVSTILCGCLDGLGMMALRGGLMCLSNLIFVLAGNVFIVTLGDVGLGLSYVIFAAVLILLCSMSIWLFQPRSDASHAEKTVRQLVKISVGFNANFFIIGICRLLLEPICKILISNFSTLEAVAVFDLAIKVTAQTLNLFSAALQSLLPLVSREETAIASDMKIGLAKWNLMSFRWSFYAMTLVVLIAPYLSSFSFGRVSPAFILQIVILGSGCALNTAGLVGYYFNMGGGRLARLRNIHIAMAAINVVTGFAMIHFVGAFGVSLSYAIAMGYAGTACALALFDQTITMFWELYRPVWREATLFAVACTITFVAMGGVFGPPSLLGHITVGCLMLGTIVNFLRFEAGELFLHWRPRQLTIDSRSG